MIRQSSSVTKLLMALHSFHSADVQVIKDSVNPHFNNTFASLGTIDRAITPALAENGLVLTQFPCVMEDGTPGLDTMLAHVSGEWMASASPLVMDKANAQGQGSGLTYLRRYATCAILRIVADEDDDANRASSGVTRPGQRTRPVTPPAQAAESLGDVLHESLTSRPPETSGEPASPKQLAYVRALIKDNGMADSDVAIMVNQHSPKWPGEVAKLSKAQAGRLIELLK